MSAGLICLIASLASGASRKSSALATSISGTTEFFVPTIASIWITFSFTAGSESSSRASSAGSAA